MFFCVGMALFGWFVGDGCSKGVSASHSMVPVNFLLTFEKDASPTYNHNTNNLFYFSRSTIWVGNAICA